MWRPGWWRKRSMPNWGRGSSSRICRAPAAAPARRQSRRPHPDGYTLLLGGTNPNAIAVSIYKSHTFEPIGDFTAVGVIGIDFERAGRKPGRARSFHQGACRLCKSKPRQAVVGRLARHRSARHAGIAPSAHRLRPGFHPLSGSRAGAHGLVGQSDSSRFHYQGSAASAHQGRQAPGTRRDQQ